MSISLSRDQEAVVNYSGKNLLVIAGAGSGKTRVLTERITKLILNLKRGEKILAITFSNKATEVLKERLIASLGEKKFYDYTYVGTIHSFCFDIISSRGSAIGLPDELHICESYNDRLHIFKEAIENVPSFKTEYLSGDSKENQKVIKAFLDDLSNAKRNLKFADDYSDDPLIQTLFEEYNNLLLQQGVIDFDDILRYTYQILTERESVSRLYRKVYKYICVDEAQDLNKAQYEVIKALAGEQIGITMVGDPNQSIYGFSGASNEYLDKIFLAEFNAHKMQLHENYRSSQLVIEAAHIIEPSFEVYGTCKYQGEFEIHEFQDEFKEAEYIMSKILFLLKNGHPDVENCSISLGQIAIIARNRYVFSRVEELLKANDLEYTLKVSAKGSFTSESDFIKAFELGIRLLVNNRDRLHFIELEKLINSKIKNGTFEELRWDNNISDHWKALMLALNNAWDLLLKNDREVKFHTAIKLLKTFIEDAETKIDEHEKILINEDIKAWEINWKSYIKNSTSGERSLGNFVRTVSLGSAQSTNDKGIVLSTVHMSKGLEYDVVFIMGLNDGVFPDYRAINAYNSSKDNKQITEERHNMFVAITRSKRLCYLTYPLVKETPWGKKRQTPSRFVLELER
ncbi:uvrD/REP helicase family protein [Paenibacillus sp. FSL R7-269]|uniref:ATP-dependent helicase n=1 Tax=Paenibacillus sp. FSL R7-269 TaxID=1226755 RepID=UPI0003E1BBA4|nr:ATP-dependent helicase [Paenibacillus sp. FSL R7-269]ETT53135.1 uvrD/REP helicase family protein [Paenibacillus sp. FSL R7-269]